jgi:hypothetical protein
LTISNSRSITNEKERERFANEPFPFFDYKEVFKMSNKKEKPVLNMRYCNGEIDDDLPYVGGLNYDEETGLIYDEEGDVVDLETVAGFCAGDGRGDDEDE